jgi:hypothetical protein
VSALFRKPADYAIAAEIAAAEREIVAHALDDPTTAEAASRKLVDLRAARQVLDAAARQARAAEHDAAAAESRRLREAQSRALSQHCGALKRHAEAIQRAIGDLAASLREAREAIGRIGACVGDTREYPDLTIAALKAGIDLEMFRASAEPTPWGDRSPLIAMPPGVGDPRRLPALVDVVGQRTRDWGARHRAALGLAGSGQPPEEVTP